MDFPRDAGLRPGALAGLRVLDLTRVLAGPYAAQLLGDLGADVIKIEKPGSGDDGRRYGVNALYDADGERSTDSSFHLAANRNKRSITLDLGCDEGRDILLALAENADILVENFRAGTMRRFGLDHETLRARNPGLIYCSLTGYGQDGPYAARPGYDGVFQAQSGLMNVTGPAAEEPGSQPYKTGPSLADISSGLFSVVGILAALNHRHVHGVGQHIDMSLLDCTVAMTSHSAMEYLISGQTLPRMGNQGNGGAPGNSFACRDGFIYLSPGTEQQYRSLCRVLELDCLLSRPEFATSALRFANRETLNPIIEQACSLWSVAHLSKVLGVAGVPAGQVNDFEGVFADPQVRHRQLKVEMEHPVAGQVAMIACPVKLSETPASYRRIPPGLGQHSDEILAEYCSMGPDEIAALKRKGVV